MNNLYIKLEIASFIVKYSDWLVDTRPLPRKDVL